MTLTPSCDHRQVLIECHLFPGILFFQLMLAYPDLVLEIHENYQKSGYRNRYYIGSAHGQVRLSVPLEKGKHQQMPMSQVKMDARSNWRTEHWRSLQTAYGKSPFFDFYKEDLYQRFADTEPSLLNWSLKNMELVLRWLGFEKQLRKTEFFDPLPDRDKVLDLRGKLKPGSIWEKEFLSKYPIRYEQVFMARQGFMENLSILDIIFCLGPEAGMAIKNSVREE